jgi:zinc transport system substrate-binding protein
MERLCVMRLAVILTIMAGPAWADVPRVVTDFGPIQSLVMAVMGDLGQPEALLPTGGDPHDFQLRPSQAQMLAGADVVFWVGPQLMPALGDAVGALADEAQVVALLPDGGGRLRDFGEGDGAGGTDPHGWLDPMNGAAWAGTIAGVLAAHDPDNAAVYEANAAALQADLAALDAELTALLAPVKDRPFVVYHDALGYFTDHYGLTVAGAIELGDASGPSAARLSGIAAVFAASGAVCVFPEVGRDPKFIASLTEGLPVRVGAAQDLEFITRQAGPGQYQAMLREIGQGIAACLAG